MATEKKHKKDRSLKKRAREEDALADAQPRPKKAKSVSQVAVVEEPVEPVEPVEEHPEPVQPVEHSRKKDKKDKKHKDKRRHGQTADAAEEKRLKKRSRKHREASSEADADAEAVAAEPAAAGAEGDSREDEERKKKKKEKKKLKLKQLEDAMDAAKEAPQEAPQETCHEAAYQPPDMPVDPLFPFFSQTISLYEAIYPVGWAQPVTSAQHQVLGHLRDKYVPSLRGVLLGYDNVALGPTPGRGADAAADDEAPTTLASRNEYAVGFGWVTADIELFVPTRGAWMEGRINLQTEGHIGVVCFGRFNASIEARRLPPAWRWVSSESPDAAAFDEPPPAAVTPPPDDHGAVCLVHSTGFWVDGAGGRVQGTVRFRIRNFDAGASGDTSYLSLEGTMLDAGAEKQLVAEEARAAQARQGGRAARTRAPDFSMTRFAAADDEQQTGPDASQGGWEARGGETRPVDGHQLQVASAASA